MFFDVSISVIYKVLTANFGCKKPHDLMINPVNRQVQSIHELLKRYKNEGGEFLDNIFWELNMNFIYEH